MDVEDAIPLLERKDRDVDSDQESDVAVEEELYEGSSLTARVWILGTMLCVLGSSISQLFFFKSNSPGL